MSIKRWQKIMLNELYINRKRYRTPIHKNEPIKSFGEFKQLRCKVYLNNKIFKCASQNIVNLVESRRRKYDFLYGFSTTWINKYLTNKLKYPEKMKNIMQKCLWSQKQLKFFQRVKCTSISHIKRCDYIYEKLISRNQYIKEIRKKHINKFADDLLK